MLMNNILLCRLRKKKSNYFLYFTQTIFFTLCDCSTDCIYNSWATNNLESHAQDSTPIIQPIIKAPDNEQHSNQIPAQQCSCCIENMQNSLVNIISVAKKYILAAIKSMVTKQSNSTVHCINISKTTRIDQVFC